MVKTPVWCIGLDLGSVHAYEGTKNVFRGIQAICVSVTPTHEGVRLNDKNGPGGPSAQVVRRTPRSSK